MSQIRRPTEMIIGTVSVPVTLTAAYAGNTSSAQRIEPFEQIGLDIYYARGTAGDSIEIKVTFASSLNGVPTAAEYASESSIATASGVGTVYEKYYTFTSSAATHLFELQIPNNAQYMKVAVKETAAGAFGTAYVKLITRHDS